MNIITLDYETYYDAHYSLTKMTTEEYIRSDRFEVIGVGVKINDQPSEWFSGTHEEVKGFLDSFNLHEHLVLAHNAIFDAAITTWHFDIRPRGWLDTLSMARALHTVEVGGSLAALVQHYGLGEKGTEVVAALGKHRDDFTTTDLAAYGGYCKNDCDITYKLFNTLNASFPAKELRLIDLTIRMFAEPVLRLDVNLLQNHLASVKVRKADLLRGAASDIDVLMSNEKLAQLLTLLGATPPRKISPTTGKEAWAFAKNDEEFKALLEHDSLDVQAVVAARLGVKSTLEETRTERMIGIGFRGAMPVPLRYYAAHTGRWGGDDKMNLQNLPRKSPLKDAIRAPMGFKIVDSDSSQIEARTLAWLAGQNDLVSAFDRGEDVYKKMASAIYGKAEADITASERFVGKTTILGCIGAGSQVLCESGWKPIEEVTLADKLWDGEEWVCHQGLLTKGLKQTLNLCGVWLTPDHKVLSGTQWLEAQLVVQDESILCRALDTGAENLPLQGISQGKEGGSTHLLLNVIASSLSTQLINKTSKTLKVLGAIFARRKHQTVSGTGSTLMPCTTMHTVSGCLIDFPLRLLGATTPVLCTTPTTVAVEFKFTRSGKKTEQRFLSTFKHLEGGTLRSLKWIGSITIKGMSRAILGLYPEATICETNAQSLPLRKNLQTYDIAYSGPRNRFTILTERGPILVHNCGYGMGAAKFQAQLKTFGVELELDECKRVIDVYRRTYPYITQLWKDAADILPAIIGDRATPLGRDGILKVEGKKGILLPNGLYMKYPNLRWSEREEGGKPEFVYDTKKGRALIPNRIYGGKLVENVCQALARIIIGDQMLLVAKKYKVVMTVHDAIACLVPDAEADTGREFVELCMRVRPSWCLELPLNCESGIAQTYGGC